MLKFLDGTGCPWHHRDVTLDGQFTGRDLVAERVDGVGRGSNKLEH